MMGFTNAVKATMVDAEMQGTVYVALHTGNPGTDGANELSGNGYARQLMEFNAAGEDGIAENTNYETYGPATTSGWPQATYYSFWSAATNGVFKGGFPLATPKTVELGDSARFSPGSLTAHV